MSDNYGPTYIPLTVSSGGSDPLLTYTVDFLRAVANAYATEEWQNVAPGMPTNLPVAATFTDEPVEGGGLNLKDLPALFLYRKQVDQRLQIAQDMRVEFGNLELLWVPPHAVQAKRRTRFQFASKLFKLFDLYLERARDPAWFVTGDSDTSAPPHMAQVIATGTTPPTVAVSGVPAFVSYILKVQITTGGARGTAIFKWSIDDGATYHTGVTTAATVVLPGTGLTLAFAVGTYSTNNVYRAVAQAYGSVLPKFALYRRLRMARMVPTIVTIDAEAERPIRYPGFVSTVEYQEELFLDATARFKSFEGVDASIELPEDPPDLPDPLVLIPDADLTVTAPT